MQTRPQVLAAWIALGIHFGWGSLADAALESGVYQTVPGATVEETLMDQSTRIVPISAILTFDLSAAEPSLTAEIANAVLEGGEPFPLTVRSSFGSRLTDGTYMFRGEYLPDTQYLFDWRFSTTNDGRVVWNGITGWAGGHIWQVTIRDITIVPRPRLSIARTGAGSVQITWSTNFPDYILEYATSLPATGWNAVNSTVTTSGDRFSVTVDVDAPQRFYRLRKPEL